MPGFTLAHNVQQRALAYILKSFIPHTLRTNVNGILAVQRLHDQIRKNKTKQNIGALMSIGIFLFASMGIVTGPECILVTQKA